MSRKNTLAKKGQQTGQLRIIGGQWRGRKLSFPAVDGLRPTPDRVRETLFNWLAPTLAGTRCLDLFAGSGALSFEALSRGAGHIDMVDAAAAAIKQLQINLQTLQCSNAKAHLSRADSWLQQAPAAPYDIIFLDPPFRQELAASCIALINQPAWLKTGGWVYLEMGREEPLPAIPAHWQLHREKMAGQICYRLFSVNAI